MNTDSIEDHRAIEQLVKNSAIGAMRRDTALWASTWVDHAVWKIDSLDEPAIGKSNVVALFEKLMSKIEFASLTSFTSELIVEGDSGHGKVYSQELIFPKAGGQKILTGCFHDKYVKQEGRWYFLSRDYETLFRSAIE